MKRSILLLFICLEFFSCKKNKVMLYQNEGVITGVDLRGCPSVIGCPNVCGGLFFHFVDTSYTANITLDNPEIFNLPSNTKFPVYVKLNWENTTRCGVTAIKITGYKIL